MNRFVRRTDLTGLCLALCWTFWLAAVALTGRQPLDACNNFNHGCVASMPVPCANATCTNFQYLGSTDMPPCVNNPPSNLPSRADQSTTLTAWYICQNRPGTSLPYCDQALTFCSNVTIYADTACLVPCTPASALLRKICAYNLTGSPGGC